MCDGHNRDLGWPESIHDLVWESGHEDPAGLTVR